jgi:hypothetical protein
MSIGRLQTTTMNLVRGKCKTSLAQEAKARF